MYMITTDDNPYNPFTQFDEWCVCDEQLGYYTWNLIARIAKVSFEESDADIEASIDAAIDRVVELNLNNKYKKISNDSKDTMT